MTDSSTNPPSDDRADEPASPGAGGQEELGRRLAARVTPRGDRRHDRARHADGP